MLSKRIVNYRTNYRRFKHNWVEPKGYDTGIKVYNCITKTKVPLIIPNKNYLSWYTCGPTVYDSAHIGHASCYVKFDTIQRVLRDHFHLSVLTVINITDIDDKIIKRSAELSVSPSELAKRYESEFWSDLHDLNITKPDVVLRVTDHIPLIIKFVEDIIGRKYAYIGADGSVYFDLSKCEQNYGKLVPISQENNRVSDASEVKRNISDFAVWKRCKSGEPSWETKWGPGRPGWHTECSALASAVFGNTVDIHAGGIDLRFPHHENEEVISCSHHDTNQWVNYWLHAGHLNLSGDSVKMSKSLGNYVTIRDMLNNKTGDVFRMACVMSHYRANMEYSSDVLNTAALQLNKFVTFLNECDAYAARNLPAAEINLNQLITKLIQTKTDIDLALKDDFNTAKVIKSLSDLVKATNKMFRQTTNTENYNLSDCVVIASVAKYVREQFKILGFTENVCASDSETINVNILNALIKFRENIRNVGIQTKDKELLKYCDALRDELKIHGIEIKDRGKITSWNKII